MCSYEDQVQNWLPRRTTVTRTPEFAPLDRYAKVREELRAAPRRWLVTGAAGFIGSHCVAELLELGQTVVALDSFVTGHRANLDDVRRSVGDDAWRRVHVVEGDIRSPSVCRSAVARVDHVLHQAALGSVPRSIDCPEDTHETNVDGFVTLTLAASRSDVRSFVYASSAAVYGDEPTLPKQEAQQGSTLSPYAASKRINEVYAEAFSRCYHLTMVGLRYFNVVGARQDPNGAYASVIPRWISMLRAGQRPTIYGDGETTRDFCPVENVVQANVLAAMMPEDGPPQVFNVGMGGATSLATLFRVLRDGMAARGAPCRGLEPVYGPFREGDIKHSRADISRARQSLGYEPCVDLVAGLGGTMDWYALQAV